jgi:hypothetical protein
MNLGGGIGAGGAGTEGSEPGEERARGVGAGKYFVSCHQNPGENLADEDVFKFTRKYKPSSLLKTKLVVSFVSAQ